MTAGILIFLFIILLPLGVFYPSFRRNIKNNQSTDKRFKFILVFLTKIYLFALGESILLALLVFHAGIKKLEALHTGTYMIIVSMLLLIIPFSIGWLIYYFQKFLMKE